MNLYALKKGIIIMVTDRLQNVLFKKKLIRKNQQIHNYQQKYATDFGAPKIC